MTWAGTGTQKEVAGGSLPGCCSQLPPCFQSPALDTWAQRWRLRKESVAVPCLSALGSLPALSACAALDHGGSAGLL